MLHEYVDGAEMDDGIPHPTVNSPPYDPDYEASQSSNGSRGIAMDSSPRVDEGVVIQQDTASVASDTTQKL